MSLAGAPSPRAAPSDRRARFEMAGMLSDALPLADPSPLPALRADAALYSRAVQDLKTAGKKRVPYFTTEAVRAVARDPAVLEVVTDLLGDDAWVMWGANIQQETPNAAGDWHVDMESWLWPSLTVVVGLSGCTPGNATQLIPGSHRLEISPDAVKGARDDAAILAAARTAGRQCDAIEQIRGFGDGRFYVFDAKTWHSGAGAASAGRLALFLHYQRASDPRVPYMKDYTRQTFFREAADYIDGSPAGAPGANTALFPAPKRWPPWG
jgi:hypothetical protein